MTYQATVTRKGQVTLPKAIRDALNLPQTGGRVFIDYDKKSNSAAIRSIPDFLEVARSLRPRINSGIDPIKSREFMEKNYERF